MSEWKSIIIGFIVFDLMAVMYYVGDTNGYARGHDRGYDLGYEYGFWRRGKLKDGDAE